MRAVRGVRRSITTRGRRGASNTARSVECPGCLARYGAVANGGDITPLPARTLGFGPRAQKPQEMSSVDIDGVPKDTAPNGARHRRAGRRL